MAWLLGGAIGNALGRGGGGESLISFLYQILVGTPISFGAAYAWLRAMHYQAAGCRSVRAVPTIL